MARLILDSSALIAVERQRLSLTQCADLQADDVAIAGVVAAELLVGVELADPSRRDRRDAGIERILASIPIEPYDLAVARAHAHLLAAARRDGRPRGPHDLIIAATARATSRTVVTLDRAGFDGLPGVVVRTPTPA